MIQPRIELGNIDVDSKVSKYTIEPWLLTQQQQSQPKIPDVLETVKHSPYLYTIFTNENHQKLVPNTLYNQVKIYPSKEEKKKRENHDNDTNASSKIHICTHSTTPQILSINLLTPPPIPPPLSSPSSSSSNCPTGISSVLALSSCLLDLFDKLPEGFLETETESSCSGSRE